MNVFSIDADNAVNDAYKAVIMFLVEAVTDWPTYDLSDFNIYLSEVKAEIKSDLISAEILTDYLQKSSLHNGSSMWIQESIHSLREALNLIEFYSLTFEEIIIEMERLTTESI
jgi:hypothetical protein